ncbi:MAG: nitroreductase family protein [Acidimicrobiia bacterium]
MDFDEVLRRRRMIRHHAPGGAVELQVLERIATAATRGPTAGNAQGVTVILVTEPTRLAAIAEACGEPAHLERGYDPWLSSAAAHLVLCVEPGRYRGRYAEPDKDPKALAIPWWWVDGGAALMAILLAAVDAGLGAGFLGGHRAGDVRRLLEIPDEVEILGVVTLGPIAADRRSASSRRPRRDDAVRHQRW